ncbi:MAG: hypothetical protein ACRCZB_05070 [Bacteroidales bacterium]
MYRLTPYRITPMLNPVALANEILSSIQSQDDPATVSKNIGQSIAKYLCDNTTVMFSWAGVQPSVPPVPDPVVVCSSDKLIGSFTCVPTYATSSAQHGLLFGSQIQKGISSLKVVPPKGFLIPPATFLTASPIILPPTNATTPIQHWTQWSSIIISTFMTYINPTPLAGVHGQFVSTVGAIMTAIF